MRGSKHIDCASSPWYAPVTLAVSRVFASALVCAFACVFACSMLLPISAWADEQAPSESAASTLPSEPASSETASGESSEAVSSGAAPGEPSGSAPSASTVDGGQADDVEGGPVEVEGEANRVDPTQRADNSFIYDTTVDSLFSQPSLYDGKIVQVSGEAIGDVFAESPVRNKHFWVTLTSVDADNPATISALMSKDQAKQIDHLGRYGVVGTTLQVRGIYHQACQEHEGIPDVHASSVSVLARGYEHPDLLEVERFIPGVLAIGLGLILMTIYYFIRERAR